MLERIQNPKRIAGIKRPIFVVMNLTTIRCAARREAETLSYSDVGSGCQRAADGDNPRSASRATQRGQ